MPATYTGIMRRVSAARPKNTAPKITMLGSRINRYGCTKARIDHGPIREASTPGQWVPARIPSAMPEKTYASARNAPAKRPRK